MALACGPLAAALLTEGRWLDEDSRVFFLVAFGLAVAILGVLALSRTDARRSREAEAGERSLRQARDQQAATAEILSAIAASPPDLQRVLDTIARNAARVCDGLFSGVFHFDGTLIRLVAHHGLAPAQLDALNRQFPVGLDDPSPTARAVREASVVHYPDVPSDPGLPGSAREIARAQGYRSLVAVPLLREGRAVGTLNAARPADAFTERQIQLLRTFADQAVIAIENVRLFQELQARNRELTEALEQQTATADILRVISSSPTNLQPALEAVAESAARLCESSDAIVFRVVGDELHPAAVHGAIGAVPNAIRPGFVTGRAVLERRTIHVEDLAVAVATDFPDAAEHQRRFGHRTTLATPLLREGVPIGAITIRRLEVRPFTEAQVRLLETFAAQAAIAIDNMRLFTELQARNRELTEALEQQTATGAILRVMSGSPTDVQPVLDAVAESATRLCDAKDVSIALVERDVLRVVASHGMLARWWPDEGVPISRGSVTGRAVVDRQAVHIHDLASESDEEFPQGKVYQRLGGHRTNLAVPLLKEGVAIGVIAMRRGEVRPFSDQQVGLLATFADQAVIAIENVRLFQELGARNRELTESLEQQTATAEILRVISSSPTDVRPVFDAIAANAARVCDAGNSNVYRFDGSLINLVASHGYTAEELSAVKGIFPIPPGPGSATARAVSTGAIAHIPDMSTDTDLAYPALVQAGFQTSLSVPMLRDGQPIGAITVARREVRPFSDRQIALLQTFAAQAVIAVENVRLFTELGARNRELTEALEQQTATADILRVISSSPTDVQPVFDSILERAIRLADAVYGSAFSFDGERIHMLAHSNLSAEALAIAQRVYPMVPGPEQMTARSILERRVIHVRDVDTDPEVSETTREFARAIGFRALLAVPMLREDRAVGVLTITRATGEFSQRHIELVKTFADQAVIAIENVRLFQELQAQTRALARSVEELRALSEVGRAVSSTLDLPTVLATIVARAVQLSGTSGGAIYEYDETTQEFQLRASHRTEETLVEVLRATPVRLGEGATGQAALRRAPVEVPDILKDQQPQTTRVRSVFTQLGYRSALGIPLLLERRILGALTVWRREPGSFPPETANLLQTFATQSVLAIQNARLFREIEAKSRELEVASRHKSQFLANMSHELRTPLNAILGYTELLVDGIYGELPAKAGDVMARIDRSGKHLLGLINDVLDLSKIEAGQLELALAEYSLKEVVHAVVTQVEPLAAEKGLTLAVTVVPDLPAGRGDDRRLAQVLLNLVGNAIKFTEAGEVRIAAHVDGDAFAVSVADTGPGIAEADRQRIFEEFQQADSSSTRKKGGTGLGLSIARRIVELHGGRLWVESTVGRGSTFSFRVPVRIERPVARG